ncbi:MAG: sarcosine oxidase subunit delta [Gemmatimonadota bacterium]|nr:sarcosine oxidase subunit delta [Gemmatimonadota bacterium]
MTFRITCPVCGSRDVYEFTYGGHERGPRPAQEGLSAEEHFRWAQFRTTRAEAQEEWWYHGAGCGVWFSMWRNPATNREERPEPVDARGTGPTTEGDGE